MTTELEQPETLTPVVIAPISNKLATANISRELIAAKRPEYDAIVIAGPDDKAGLKIAKDAKSRLRTTRGKIEAVRKEENEEALRTQRLNNAVAKELISLIEEIENPLDEKIKVAEDAIQAIKDAKAAAEAAKIAARHASLSALKAVFDGSSYTVVDVTIDSIEVNALPDEDWNHLYASAELAYQKEQARLAEEQRVRDEEAARIAAEQQAERDRQAVIAREQEAERERLRLEQEEFYRKQREFQAEQKRVADEQAARQADLDRQQKEAEQKRLQAERDELEKKRTELLAIRVPQLLDLGFKQDTVSPTVNTYTFGTEWYTGEEVAEFSDPTFEDILIRVAAEKKQIEQAYAEAEKQRIADEKAKNKADKDRAKRLAPDKRTFLVNLEMIVHQDNTFYQQPEVLELVNDFNGELTLLIAKFRQWTEAL